MSEFSFLPPHIVIDAIYEDGRRQRVVAYDTAGEPIIVGDDGHLERFGYGPGRPGPVEGYWIDPTPGMTAHERRILTATTEPDWRAQIYGDDG